MKIEFVVVLRSKDLTCIIMNVIKHHDIFIIFKLIDKLVSLVYAIGDRSRKIINQNSVSHVKNCDVFIMS